MRADMVFGISNEHFSFRGSHVINECLIFDLYQEDDPKNVGGSFFFVILTNSKRVSLVCIN